MTLIHRHPPSLAPTEFSLRELSAIAYANGFTQWHYRARTLQDVRRTGFFADAGGNISVGDTVVVSCPTGTMQGWVDATGTLRPMEIV